MGLGYAEDVERQLIKLIVPLGFKAKHGVLWFEIAEETRGFLGLPRATYGTSTVADFGLVAGMRFEKIYQLQVALGASPDSKTGCNISAPVEYVAPKGQRWRFEKDTDNSAAIKRVVSDVSTYVVQFYSKFCSPDAAIREYDNGAPTYISGWSSFVPTALLSAGRYDQASSCAREFAKGFDAKRHVGRTYHQFVRNLEQACENSRMTKPH